MTAPSTKPDENPDAYGRRHRVRAQLRHTLRRITRRLMWTFSKPLGPETRFLPLPAIDDSSLADYAARTTWYLGRWSRPAAVGSDDLTVPGYLDPSIDSRGSEQTYAGSGPVHHLVWRVTPRTYLRALARPSRVTIVDPSFAKDVDSEGYLEVAKQLGRVIPPDFITGALAQPHHDWSESSALVLGTGPSAGDIEGDHTTWTYRIVCNSAIRDKDLMERLRPTHISFGDPVFHFGPSAYAGEFRRDLREVAEKYDSILVVPGYCAGLIAANLPWTRGRMLPLDLESKSWHAPTMDALEVRRTGNVLTQQMVPLGIAIASKVDIGGADGRKPDEKYFWTHSPSHQYSDTLMNSVFDAHPAFFRDTDYADYYAEHCAAMDDLISYGETRGCRFTTVTNSYIPALASRMRGA
jgi:hypothetical protein